jgi:prolyl-tRNA synthetase
MSQLLGHTLREAPVEAEHEAHRLLLRARLVQQLAAGVYSYLPLGWRALRKVEEIVRQEMDRAGGQEVHMPALHPVELWEESGRREVMGDTLMTVIDRRERALVLGPTHEEVVVDLFRHNVQSYKELPKLIYQIQTKFRDEQRPRMGLIRGREFDMMDLYSFDADDAGLNRSYAAMYEAYSRVFERCGVPTTVVLADSGAIGGKESQEFMLITETGEDVIILCPNGDYAANTERAEHRKSKLPPEAPKPVEEVSTPGTKTIETVARLLGTTPDRTLKAAFFIADRQPVFVAIRGDLEINEVKLRNALKARDLRLMTDEEAASYGIVAGFASPVGLTGMRVLADDSVVDSANLVAGANKPDHHMRNVNYGRDWQAEEVTDLSLAREGDLCPNCGAPFEYRRGIEMGHIFKLGTVYSERMGARFLDADGEERPAIMGCYGIGTSRLLHCIIEANYDERGIVWPKTVAPFDVHLVGLGLDRPEVASKAQQMYEALLEAGIEALYDDRPDATAGVKFNDADLLGMPVRVTVSPRSLEKGAVEVKLRSGSDLELVPCEEAAERLRGIVRG